MASKTHVIAAGSPLYEEAFRTNVGQTFTSGQKKYKVLAIKINEGFSSDTRPDVWVEDLGKVLLD